MLVKGGEERGWAHIVIVLRTDGRGAPTNVLASPRFSEPLTHPPQCMTLFLPIYLEAILFRGSVVVWRVLRM